MGNFGLTINGTYYSANKLSVLCDDKICQGPQWEQELYGFIKLWAFGCGPIALKTSGSTGTPKTIYFERSAFIASAKATIDYFGLATGSRLLLCLPAQYVAARLMVVRAFVGQMDLVAVEPSSHLLAVLNQPIDFAAMVPLQVHSALEQSPAAFRLVRQLIVGGSEVSSALKSKLKEVTTQCWETYGMTETLTHVAVKRINGPLCLEVFEALPGIAFSVDERQCLVVDVPRIVNTPIVTNDVVDLLSVHRFVWKGRVDNIINSGGVKIYPETVAKKVAPYIGMPFEIVGMADERLGQQVVMVVEGQREGVDFELIFNSAQLERYERPKEVYVLELFPRSVSGKVLRQELLRLLH